VRSLSLATIVLATAPVRSSCVSIHHSSNGHLMAGTVSVAHGSTEGGGLEVIVRRCSWCGTCSRSTDPSSLAA
jgi:hypothetical protein